MTKNQANQPKNQANNQTNQRNQEDVKSDSKADDKNVQAAHADNKNVQLPEGFPQLSEKEMKEIEEKINEVKKKVEVFTKDAREKFKEYILGVAILPPDKKGQKEINTLILVDDSDSKKMSKDELRDKISTILTEMGKKQEIAPKVILLTELWQACFDSNYELLQMVAISSIVYDKGVLEATKVAEVHKSLVLKKFDKYIVAYVCAGGIFRGQGHEKSDVDAFIVIDDTDVKKMTRFELQDKLRAIIYQMAFEAAAITGIKRQLHVQTYLLTDFWDTIKDSASPVIFTFLRDGIPFYDRGIYMSWKHLLDMGRIVPSREAIRKFNASGDHFYDTAKKKLISIAVEDAYYSVLNPSQAALMMKGIAPPTHKETGRLVREIFVEKEKLLEKKYADILDEMIDYFKKFDYGEIKEISGKDIDRIMKNVEAFRGRIGKLYKQIETQADKETVVTMYDAVLGAAREVLKSQGIDNVKDSDLLREFETSLVKKGITNETVLRELKEVFKAKADYEKNDLKPAEIDAAQKQSRSFVKTMAEILQKSKHKLRESKTLRIKHAKGVGEVLVLEKELFILNDGKVEKAVFNKDGSLGTIKASSSEELDKALEANPNVATLNAKAISALESHLGTLELLV